MVAYQKLKDAVNTHPCLKDKATLGPLSHLQSLLLAGLLRGDPEGYPAFIAK